MLTDSNISIVTVSYNNLSGLLDTYYSIIRQRYYCGEWVVVDGGSDDGSIEWLKNCDPPFPFRWISERDKGIYDAMNKGIALAGLDYLLFLNSGDFFEGQVMPCSVTSPSFLPTKAVDLLGRDSFKCPRSERSGLPIPHQGIIFRSSGKNHKYNIKYRYGADWDFFLSQGLTAKLPMIKNSGWVRYSRGGVTDKNIYCCMRELTVIAWRYFGLWGAARVLAFDLFKLPLKLIRRDIFGWTSRSKKREVNRTL